jgi:hypothetical protein
MAQNRKTPSGGDTHQRGGRGGDGGLIFAEELTDVVVFDDECGLDVTRVERGVCLTCGRMGEKSGRRGGRQRCSLAFMPGQRGEGKSVGAPARCASKWRRREGGVRRGSQMAGSDPRMVVVGELWRQRTAWAHAHRQGRWGRLLGGAPT